VGGGLTGSTLLDEVADLVEYPAVVAGSFPDEFLRLPEEVLTTTMIHHQHYFPVVDAEETLLPVFLAVTNIEVDEPHRIAVNAERVLVARLRDARFFWESDRGRPLESRLERLDTLQFHRTLGSYRAKADRLERLAAWIVTSVFERPALADAARRAGRLAKVDLTTDMVREFTELQGTMGGIYAREEGAPDEVWRAIYHHYLPVAPEPGAPPAAEQLGRAAATWAAVSLADKLDSIVGLFSAGERPTGTRDPFGMRRQLQGALRVLVELPELTGLAPTVQWQTLVAEASSALAVDPAPFAADLQSFAADRLRHLFSLRGFRAEEIEAALFSLDPPAAPLTARRRLEALREHRGSTEFQALAALFKRVRNLAREISPEPQASYPDGFDRGRLSDPAERQLLAAYDAVAPRIRAATAAGDYRSAVSLAAGLRPQVDEFFARVFVMADDDQLRRARLMLLVHLRDLVLEVGDIAHLSTDVPATAAERAG
jgi:glycyl-tRNA synthetase beta chain